MNGDWAPDIEEIQRPLRTVHGIDPGSLGTEELLTLHDSDHDRRRHRHGHAHQEAASPVKGYARF